MIRVKNKMRAPIQLPAPFQKVLSGGESAVLNTSMKKFFESIGTGGGDIYEVSSAFGEASTVDIDETLTDEDRITLIADGTGYAASQKIEVSTTGDVATVVLKKSATGGDIDAGVIYTIKDVGGNAAANNITVNCSSTFTGGSSADYVINVNGGSVQVYKNAATGRFVALPGMGSGGGSSTPTQEYLSGSSRTITAIVDTIVVNQTAGPATITLPAITAALDGNITSIKMEVADVSGTAGTNTITIQPDAGDTGTLINGSANATISSNYGSVTLQAVNYDGITYVAADSLTKSGKHWKLS